MRRFSKSMLGVTLLEIMLVLAVAAMIIVMSVRYYQSATASQESNATMEQVSAITAAADGIAQGSNTYSAVTQSAVKPMMPNQTFATPWGGTVTITTGKATTYSVTITSVPVNVCSQIVPKLAANTKFTGVSPATAGACTTIGDVKYTYDAALQ